MAVYSHSKLSTFEQCRYKYWAKYIEKIEVEVPTTVEAFMGSIVHEVLEKLYRDVQHQKVPDIKDVLALYYELWKKGWTDDILIAKEEYSEENYRLMGAKYVEDYYNHYKPFDQMKILGLETQDLLTLPDGNKYHVRIDRLCCDDDIYYVCDYKTSMWMLDQEAADSDRQLAMYSIWVQDKFKDAKKVILLWNMLAFDKEVMSERSEDELEHLKMEVMRTIDRIETCTEWPTNVSALCNWCEFKEVCPSFKHEVELEKKSAEEFKEDDGVRLVDSYSEAYSKKKEADSELDSLKQKLIDFSSQMGVDTVYGSNKKVRVKEQEKIVLPENKEVFLKLLKSKGLYDDFSMLNFMKLNSAILKDRLDPEISGLVDRETAHRVSLSNR